MPDVTIANEASADPHAYARFTRRVQGVLVDAIILMFILAGALVVAVSLASDNIVRILGFYRRRHLAVLRAAVGVPDRRNDWPLSLQYARGR